MAFTAQFTIMLRAPQYPLGVFFGPSDCASFGLARSRSPNWTTSVCTSLLPAWLPSASTLAEAPNSTLVKVSAVNVFMVMLLISLHVLLNHRNNCIRFGYKIRRGV